MKFTNLDMDCLRTFSAIIEFGSFAVAAQSVGRSASAVSLQIGRLENQVGTKLFHKVGRRMLPSPEGEHLINAASHILNLNDEIIESLTHRNLTGEIRIGAIQDFADSILPTVLARFGQAHSGVRIIAKVDRSEVLADMVDKGSLDLAIGVHGSSKLVYEIISTEKMVWLSSPDFVLNGVSTIPLIVFDPPCEFRRTAIDGLNQAGRTWEIVFTSPSLSGLKAAINAGLGITVRTRNLFGQDMKVLPKSSLLPELPTLDFAIYAKQDLAPPAERLCQIIKDVM